MCFPEGCDFSGGGTLAYAPDMWRATVLSAVLLASATASAASDPFAAPRARMIAAIDDDVRVTTKELGKPQLDPRVMRVMASVPRHLFVPRDLQSSAYENRPLPIGYGQTISQPYIVAIMTDLLGAKPGDVVLEVGTGSGYQAAVLSRLASRVYSVEILEPLAKQAAERLRTLRYDNVSVRQGDGYYGWKEAAPFDAIIVTAAASHIPPPLIEQLKPGGTMMIPVGAPFSAQSLLLVRKNPNGRITTRQVLPVSFVPLTGGK